MPVGRLGTGYSRLASVPRRRAYSPTTALGADLIAYWDAERADLITQGAGAVSSWRDVVAGLAMTQATGTAQPVWNATSFNGAPGVAFDGVDDCLATTGVGTLPTGATPCEVWVLVQQDALGSNAVSRTAFAYGGATGQFRAIGRVVVATVNRGTCVTGDGAANSIVGGTAVDLSGRHVIRWAVGATSSAMEINGTSEGGAAVVPGTATARARIGASSGVAGTAFWQGQVAVVIVTKPLAANKATLLQSWLMSRRRL